jgi:hypothetical protein
MHTRRPARLKHVSYIGIQRYSLTFCTDWRQKWFENADAVQLVLSQFLRVALWQPFGYEHVLRDDEKATTTARYILENPVRAGLSKTVMEYPFVGSQVYELKDLLATLPERD